MTPLWRAGIAAASICLADPAAAQQVDDVPEEAAAAAAVDSPIEAVEQVRDRLAPTAVERKAPAIDLSLVYTAEVFRNARGGLGRGTRYLDNLDVTLAVDAGRAFGWQGATLFAYGLYNNGNRFSEDLVGAAQGLSNIETGVRAVRLYEAWIEQRLLSDRASLKIGLYDLNSEFDAIDAAALFLNPSHGIGPASHSPAAMGPRSSRSRRWESAVTTSWPTTGSSAPRYWMLSRAIRNGRGALSSSNSATAKARLASSS